MLFWEINDVYSDIHKKHKNRICCSAHNCFVCVSLVTHEEKSGLLNVDNCREFVDSLPELRPRTYEGNIVSVLH